MKKKLCVTTIFFLCLQQQASPFYLDKTDKTPCRLKETITLDHNLNTKFSLTKPSLQNYTVSTDPLALQQAVRDAKGFLNRYWETHKAVISPQPFSTQILSAKKVRDTLDFIDEVIEEDKKTGNFRILDPSFLEQNFGLISWQADCDTEHKQHKQNKKIKLTSYVIYKAKASYERSPEFPCALYRLKSEKNPIRLKKQNLLDGSLENNPELAAQVQALAWVSRDTLEEAMLQGTVILHMPDGKEKAFTANISNGYKFSKALGRPINQEIYWFFLERKNEKFIQDAHRRKNVIFAGNLPFLGLGKIIALQYTNPKKKKKEILLGILGDHGSAFEKNRYQLDLFGGIINNKTELKKHLSNFPPTVETFIVYRK